MKLRRSIIIVGALALAASACGSKVANLNDQQPGTSSSVVPTSTSSSPAALAPRASASTIAAARQGKTAPVAIPTGQEQLQKNDFAISLSLNATCATPGQTMRAEVATIPGATLALTSYYESNNGYTPDLQYVPGEADPSGTFTWTWVLKPDTPLGRAKVTALAGKSGRGGASASRYFLVARSC
jgi:hypothetical protein